MEDIRETGFQVRISGVRGFQGRGNSREDIRGERSFKEGYQR